MAGPSKAMMALRPMCHQRHLHICVNHSFMVRQWKLSGPTELTGMRKRARLHGVVPRTQAAASHAALPGEERLRPGPHTRRTARVQAASYMKPQYELQGVKERRTVATEETCALWQTMSSNVRGLVIRVERSHGAAGEDHLRAVADHGQQVVLVGALGVLRQPPLLDDQRVQPQLLVRLLDDLRAPCTRCGCAGFLFGASGSCCLRAISMIARNNELTTNVCRGVAAVVSCLEQVGIDGQGLTVQAGAMPLKAHLLLDGVVDAEAKDLHLLLLPDAVRPVHGLQAAAASC